MQIDVSLMRGGTSRGPVVSLADMPSDEDSRDELLLRLLNGLDGEIDGLAGGTPTTSKAVVVGASSEPTVDYAVANLVIGAGVLDWEGTCGNMTAAAALYAVEQGSVAAGSPVRLRNLSTAGIIEAEVLVGPNHRAGMPARVRTTYLEPGGSVCGAVLPTGSAIDLLDVNGRRYECTMIDVAHPFAIVSFEAVVGDRAIGEPIIVAELEHIRRAACVRMGRVTNPGEAAGLPAVPRLVLARERPGPAGELEIVAVSMGAVITTVPVTAALCLAAACRTEGTIVERARRGLDASPSVTVAALGSSVVADADVGPSGEVRSVSVERTARTLLRGSVAVGSGQTMHPYGGA